MLPVGTAGSPSLPRPPAAPVDMQALGALGLPSASGTPVGLPAQQQTNASPAGTAPQDVSVATCSNNTQVIMDHDGSSISTISSESPNTVIYEYANNPVPPSSEDDTFQLVVPSKRRRRASKMYLATPDNTVTATPPKHGLTVILKPVDSTKIITRFNPLALKDSIEAKVPDGVLQLRPNYRLNLLAIDTRNTAATEHLLKITAIGDIPVRTYEPRPENCARGVIRGVPQDISDSELYDNLRQRTPVRSARRLGTSRVVQIVFATDTRPDYVILGYTRYQVYDYSEKPTQCTRCQRFGHIAATCTRKLRCARCGGDHELAACKSAEKLCANCGKTHQADFPYCPTFLQVKGIYRYKSENKVDYKAAKAAVLSKKRSGKRNTSNINTKEPSQPVSEEMDFDVTDFPPLQPQSSDQVPQSPARPTGPEQHARKRSNQMRVSQSNREPSANSSSSLFTLIEAVSSILAPFSSPVAQAILTLLNTITPLLREWL